MVVAETGLHFTIKQRLVTDKIIWLTKLTCWKIIGPLLKVLQPWSNETCVLKVRAIRFGLSKRLDKKGRGYLPAHQSGLSYRPNLCLKIEEILGT